MKSKGEIRSEIRKIKSNLKLAKLQKNKSAELWLKGYWTALGWVIEGEEDFDK